MANAGLEAEAWRAAAACEMDEAGTLAGEQESQQPAAGRPTVAKRKRDGSEA